MLETLLIKVSVILISKLSKGNNSKSSEYCKIKFLISLLVNIISPFVVEEAKYNCPSINLLAVI